MSTTTSTSVPGPDELPHDVANKLKSELGPNERVMWSGQPLAHRRSRAALPAFLFGIPWTAFAVFWTVAASIGSVLFAMFGLPFIGIGVGLLASPWLAARAARKSVYAVTSERVIAIEAGKGFTTTVRSYRSEHLGVIERREHSDGSGDLIFVKRMERDSEGDRRTIEEGMMGVADVRRVERHVRDLIDAIDARRADESGTASHSASNG